MADYVKSFMIKGKKGAAHVVRNREGRLSVMAENADGFTDWPIRYPTGRIAWDHPERMPEYVKVLVRRAFRAIASGAVRRENDGQQDVHARRRRS